GLIAGLGLGGLAAAAAAGPGYYGHPAYAYGYGYPAYGYRPRYVRAAGHCWNERRRSRDDYGNPYFRRVRVCN
ncbi:hypothetical protein ACFQ12_11255, partial [Methylobacterium trifolii]